MLPVKQTFICVRRSVLATVGHCLFSLSIHAMSRSTIFLCCASVSSTPFGTRYHLFRQPLQQQAQACWATNTGCPLMGVCLPSLGITAGASLARTKSAACARTASNPFSAIYRLSLSVRWNLARNEDFCRRSSASSIVAIERIILITRSFVCQKRTNGFLSKNQICPQMN